MGYNFGQYLEQLGYIFGQYLEQLGYIFGLYLEQLGYILASTWNSWGIFWLVPGTVGVYFG